MHLFLAVIGLLILGCKSIAKNKKDKADIKEWADRLGL